jgi:3-phosphoshikimate 1-carboxyvinyltransferase
MRRITEPLTQMGASIAGGQAGGAREIYPPLTIHGRRPLQAIRYTLPVASAQVKSAVLLAGLFASGRTTVVEPVPTRDHTERALSAFGVRVERLGAEVSVVPGRLLSPGGLTIPGDFSSAAFFLVAAVCVPGAELVVEGVSLNPSRLGLLALLTRMGAHVHVVPQDPVSWEPGGSITARASQLRAIEVRPEEVAGIIDELPILMVAAACAGPGTSRFSGLGELRVKETDRIASMVEGLQRLGVTVRTPAPDVVEIEGGRPLVGRVVDSAGDHRTAMSLAVAGLVAQGTTRIQGAGCVAKSFPDFFEQLQRLTGGSSTVKTVDKA